MTDKYDFIIVGSGAGGAAAAWRLAEAGRMVLVIEKGHQLPRDGSTLDIDTVFRRGAFSSREEWRDRHGRVIVPDERFNLGGKTKWYGAALLRFDDREFAAEPDFQCFGWPIAPADLAPYYEEAERLLGVRQFDIEPDLKKFVAAFGQNGEWRAEPLPLGLSADILNCTEEAKRFDGFAIASGRKADAEFRLLDRIRSRPNVRIVTASPVAELVPDPQRPDRVAGVTLSDGSRFSAGAVFLAAGALHSPRLLSRYLSRRWPDHGVGGLAYVGRYLKRHLLTAVVAFSPAVKHDVLRKTVLLTNTAWPHSSVQPLFAMDEGMMATQLPRAVPGWLSEMLGRRAYGFFLQTEDGSHMDNRVWEEKRGTQPILDMDLGRIAPSAAEHKAFVRGFCRSVLRSGWLPVARSIPLTGTAHVCGTLFAGTNPNTSVVRPDGRVHGFTNLYVVDGSVLPRSSRVNPALTIYAWALRVADSISKRGTADGARRKEAVL